jgi:hypothetical protein
MTAKLATKHKEHKKDIINLVILISITSLLGLYLIATTVMITKDGVFFILSEFKNFQPTRSAL